MATSKQNVVPLQKRQHALEREMLPLKLQKEVQLQGEESVLPVRKAALREKHLREKAALRSEKEDKQYLPLISPFYFFN